MNLDRILEDVQEYWVYYAGMAMCGVLILFCFYGCTMDMKQSTAFREKCEASGGVYYRAYKSTPICLDREDLKVIR